MLVKSGLRISPSPIAGKDLATVLAQLCERMPEAMHTNRSCICQLSAVCSTGRGPFREIRKEQYSILFVEGEPAEQVYLVRTGSVSLHRASTENRALGRTHAVCHSGTLLGIEALVAPVYQSSARAETALTLCKISKNKLEEWIASDTMASRTLLERVLHNREQDFFPRTSIDGTAAQRVAHWILERSADDAERNLPRALVADMLGMCPETLSRALRELSERGYVEVSRRQLLVIDPEGLRSLVPI